MNFGKISKKKKKLQKGRSHFSPLLSQLEAGHTPLAKVCTRTDLRALNTHLRLINPRVGPEFTSKRSLHILSQKKMHPHLRLY